MSYTQLYNLCPGTTGTNYQLWKGRKPNIKYFNVFGSKCYILNDKVYHQKWDSKLDEGIFFGYSIHSKVYRVYNQRTQTIIESLNVRILNPKNPTSQSVFDVEGVLGLEDLGNKIEKSQTDKSDRVQKSPDVSSDDISDYNHNTNLPTSERCLPVDPSTTSTNNDANTKLLAPSAHVKKNHPVSNVIGKIDREIATRKKIRPNYAKMITNVCFASTIEPSTIWEALQDNQWIQAI